MPATDAPPLASVTSKPPARSARHDRRGALQVADAEEMLHVEEDFHLTFNRSMLGLPPVTLKK
jgi:hypothetical protein